MVRGIAEFGRRLGDGRVAHFGASFGGNFAAMSGLSGIVDAAVDLGGPVADSFHAAHLDRLPYGLHDILGNTMHWDRSPSLDELAAGMGMVSRRELLTQPGNAPMLVINGADDYFVPQPDTLVFEGRPNTGVHPIAWTGHVAMSSAGDVVPTIIGWLHRQLTSLSQV